MGFIARKDGSLDWLQRPRPKGNCDGNAFYRPIDTCLLGRKTHDVSVRHGRPEPCAGKKNYVFSRTLAEAASRQVTLVKEDVASFSERLRKEKGKDAWLMGGAELVAAFVDCGQVDEFIIHVIPKMIGEGVPSVDQRHRDLSLKLLATKRFADGVVRVHYAFVISFANRTAPRNKFSGPERPSGDPGKILEFSEIHGPQ